MNALQHSEHFIDSAIQIVPIRGRRSLVHMHLVAKAASLCIWQKDLGTEEIHDLFDELGTHMPAVLLPDHRTV